MEEGASEAVEVEVRGVAGLGEGLLRAGVGWGWDGGITDGGMAGGGDVGLGVVK